MIRFNKKLVKAAQERERIGLEESPTSQIFDIRTSTVQARKRTCTELWDRPGQVILTWSLVVSHYLASDEL